MKRRILSCLLACSAAVLLCTACSGNKDKDNSPYRDLKGMSEEQMTAYMIKHASPDSVARFLFYAAMGEIEGVKIDSISIASLYAYEYYTGDDFDTFSAEYADFPERQPLAKKLKISKLIGTDDPMAMGYRLGLCYVNQIRLNALSAEEIEKELNEFRQACADDPEVYERAMNGFAVALKSDHGRDVPKAIYDKYVNFTPSESAE